MCKGCDSQQPYDDDREQFVHNYITNRYPGLKGKDFFVTGLTDEEQKSWDIRKPWENYGQLTDEQIEATHLFVINGVVKYRLSHGAHEEHIKRNRYILRLNDIPLTEEEMNYLAKIREIQDGKRDKTDIPMPSSLKKLIETQEKTLQYNSQDKEVAAFNELEADRKELFENKNQQPRLTAALNAAQEHKENDNTSSNTLPEKER